MHGKLNEKIDVYAFGVVLLELLSGRKPIDNAFPVGHQSLVMWVRKFSISILLIVNFDVYLLYQFGDISLSIFWWHFLSLEHSTCSCSDFLVQLLHSFKCLIFSGKTHYEGRKNLRNARS